MIGPCDLFPLLERLSSFYVFHFLLASLCLISPAEISPPIPPIAQTQTGSE